jgi:hypothetical protein
VVEQPYIKETVICLPHLVGTCGFPPVQQVERLLVDLQSVLCQSAQAGIEPTDNAADATVTGDRPTLLRCNCRHLAMHGGRGGWRCAQDQPLDEFHNLWVHATGGAVAAWLATQVRQSMLVILMEPVLHGTEGYLVLFC